MKFGPKDQLEFNPNCDLKWLVKGSLHLSVYMLNHLMWHLPCCLQRAHVFKNQAFGKLTMSKWLPMPWWSVSQPNSHSFVVITWRLLSARYTDQDFHELVHMEETIDKSTGNRVAADQSLILDQQGNENPITSSSVTHFQHTGLSQIVL